MSPLVPSKIMPAAALCLAMALFGSAGVFVKTLTVVPAAIAFFRFAVPFFATAVTRPGLLIAALQKPNRLLLLVSCITASRIYCWVLGFMYAPMVLAVLVLYTWPLFLTLFSVIFLHERPGRGLWALLALAFAGVAVIVSERVAQGAQIELLGLLLMGIVAVLNAMVMTLFKPTLRATSPLEVMMYDNFVGTVVFSWLGEQALLDIAPADAALGLVYGLVVGYVACRLLFFGYQQVSPPVLAVLSYLEVLSACAFGVFWFGEKITPAIALGGGLTLSALLGLTYLKSRHAQRQLEGQEMLLE